MQLLKCLNGSAFHVEVHPYTTLLFESFGKIYLDSLFPSIYFSLLLENIDK